MPSPPSTRTISSASESPASALAWSSLVVVAHEGRTIALTWEAVSVDRIAGDRWRVVAHATVGEESLLVDTETRMCDELARRFCLANGISWP